MAERLNEDRRPLFTARSGNVCHYEVREEGKNRAILAGWEKPPTERDHEEAEQFFRREALRRRWVQDAGDMQFVPHAHQADQARVVAWFLRYGRRPKREMF